MKTTDEFNTKFRCVVADLPREIKPRDASILIYYIEAFTGGLRYQLRDEELADLKTTQELAEKIEKNMQSSGKSNIPWCRPCEQFHQESTCYVANQVMEHGLPKVSNQETNSRDPNHIYMVGQAYPLLPSKQYKLEDETIVESYSETYDENCNVHDGTPTCDLFSEEDEYESKDKYSLEHDTNDEHSLIPNKDIDEES